MAKLSDEAAGVVKELNPWWFSNPPVVRPDPPTYRRPLVTELSARLRRPKGPIEVIRGPRQVGKTTGIYQIVQDLLRDGVDPTNIIFIRFDLDGFVPNHGVSVRNCSFVRPRPLESLCFRLVCGLHSTAVMKRRLHSTPAMTRRNDCNFTIAAIQTVDALAEALVGDEAGILPSSSPRFPQTGERRLIRDLINGALAEAAATPRNKQEAEALADARAWLRNELATMSARYCFEALEIDYDAAIEKLEEAWKIEAKR